VGLVDPIVPATRGATHSTAATLEEAKAKFRAAWDRQAK
jgi:hypothetical protein